MAVPFHWSSDYRGANLIEEKILTSRCLGSSPTEFLCPRSRQRSTSRAAKSRLVLSVVGSAKKTSASSTLGLIVILAKRAEAGTGVSGGIVGRAKQAAASGA